MKKRFILLVIGLIMVLVPYFINFYSIYRLLSILIGLILIELALIINKKDKVWRIVLLPLIFLSLAFSIDYGVVHLTNHIPIFANKIKSSKKVITYNSLFYRVYSCDNKLIKDDLYKKDYVCEGNLLKTIDITSFLNNTIENYNEYKDKFVKISGKVSKVNGTYNLELQGYTLTEESINGYVLFSDNVTLEVNFNDIIDLTSYKVYDSITIIGRIDELVKKGENYTVKMYDSKILRSELYNTYEISIIENNSCENDKEEYAKTETITYYTSCLSKIYVKYNEENVYDLSYVLLDKKITLDSLISNSTTKEELDGNTLYEYENFKILSCANGEEIIVGNKKLKVDSAYCKVEEPKDEEL